MTKEKKDLLVFGYGLAVIAVFFGTGSLIKHGVTFFNVVLFVCAVIFTSVTALDWKALRPGYRGWMKVAGLIGTVVTTVILSAVFFAVFTPLGIFFRLVRKDFLDRSVDRTAASYWRMRPKEAFDPERCRQQF